MKANAIQFTGSNCLEVLCFIDSPYADNLMLHTADSPVIQLRDGQTVVAYLGDWIIRVASGMYIVCQPRGIPGVADAPIDFHATMARIDYTNWRGQCRERKIVPIRIEHGPNKYHPTKCALLVAWDMDMSPPIEKTFALAGIHSWKDLPDRA
jgi:hypothetical protein